MDIIQNVQKKTFDITLSGAFTFNDNKAFRDIINQIETLDDLQKIIFRIDKLTFVDSAALGMLLLAYDAGDKTHKRIILKGPTGQVKKMLELTHFQRLFIIE
ncbi:MAG: STAS domain-containing protein [Alphaproteobacteria bacterium]|nr:STAS domain-containing protein [Alphaproteobacteria bacterium]